MGRAQRRRPFDVAFETPGVVTVAPSFSCQNRSGPIPKASLWKVLRLVAKIQKSDPSPFLLSRVAGVLNSVRIQTSTPAVLRCWDATGRMLSIEPLEGNTGMESMERQVPMGTFLVSLHPAMEGPKPMILKLGAF